MPDATMLAALNDLLINVGRSLLQYVGECWPWADANTLEERRTIERLVQKQKQQVGELANLLLEAEWPLDYGTYPTEYTDLHYVALDYLLDQLIQNQRALVQDATAVLAVCSGDPEARKLVEEIRDVQESIAGELESFANDVNLRQAKPV
jgi:hypothetical protein